MQEMRMMMRRMMLVGLTTLLVACDDSTSLDFCQLSALPLRGNADGPTVTAVGLEIQSTEIVLVATATDPQGSANLRDIPQSIGVFPDNRCEGAPLRLEDDLAESGVEETFGTVVTSTGNAALYQAIAAASSWPVEVDFIDVDGNGVAGRVGARIIR
jgi:hypothetical protein